MHTRHVEAKYNERFANFVSELQSQVPGAQVLFNQVPKDWYTHELYCQLVPNEDVNCYVYNMIPRIGAFEVSTVWDGTAILLYSKMASTMWPHVGSLCQRISEYAEEARNGRLGGAALKEKYQTTGTVTKASRAASVGKVRRSHAETVGGTGR